MPECDMKDVGTEQGHKAETVSEKTSASSSVNKDSAKLFDLNEGERLQEDAIETSFIPPVEAVIPSATYALRVDVSKALIGLNGARTGKRVTVAVYTDSHEANVREASQDLGEDNIAMFTLDTSGKLGAPGTQKFKKAKNPEQKEGQTQEKLEVKIVVYLNDKPGDAMRHIAVGFHEQYVKILQG